jgi:hypothetical protein
MIAEATQSMRKGYRIVPLDLLAMAHDVLNSSAVLLDARAAQFKRWTDQLEPKEKG